MINDCCKKRCCDNDQCGCPLRVLSVCESDEKPGTLEFDLDGHPVEVDLTGLVAKTQTDTHLRIDSASRALRLNAERHTNNISASQLGSILHLADIGDVDIHGVTNNSLLAYQKNSDCGKDCDGIKNSWYAWNSDEHLEDSGETVMVFDSTNAPKALQTPLHTDQYYSLMWRAGDKVGYTQPVEASAPSTDANGFSQLLFVNPTTRQLESLKVAVSIDNQGNVTFNTQGGA